MQYRQPDDKTFTNILPLRSCAQISRISVASANNVQKERNAAKLHINQTILILILSLTNEIIRLKFA